MVTKKINNKVIKIGYTDVTIDVTLPNFKKDNLTDCYGQYLQRENKIALQPNLTNIEEANTLVFVTFTKTFDFSCSLKLTFL